ncbi:arginyl-tRNA--protein transferase 1-like [Xenia sp. Carnegie-2017]|uniref:arginyl-tRNA--protein transferase 1-like n=1 Tax=Xenia sp. Carnegie-2017 TaxID=2897299 RepID=UPI001F0360B2|nr:arginyl-tRNA--protein transferase 1-like [Xenia sp. Carnegie-2017]
MSKNVSIVEYFYEPDNGDKKGHRCGYCNGSNTSISQGMWGHQITCQDYQDLIDRGWRRSGEYLYKPDMKRTCCPLYPIRCGVMEFKPSKSQKKVLKNVRKFLLGKSSEAETQSSHNDKEPRVKQEASCEKKNDATFANEEGHSVGADPNKPRCRKAKEIRLQRKRRKLAAKGLDMPEAAKKQDEGKSLEDLIAEHLPQKESKHRLEVKLVRVDMTDRVFRSTLRESHDIFIKYQMNIHKDKPCECNFKQFRRFLLDSPLVFEKHSSTPSTGWGSFHEQFFLDGKLIAVGVLDILPHCISSVYFYYDTDYSYLSLGKYSALREISFARELNQSSSALRFYYLGFYVHSCAKMNYKGQYFPSYLACPETFSWIPLEKCLPKLDAAKYSRLDETDKEDPVVSKDTVQVLFKYRGFKKLLDYQTLKARFQSKDDGDEVQQYAQLVGSVVAQRMALIRK